MDLFKPLVPDVLILLTLAGTISLLAPVQDSGANRALPEVEHPLIYHPASLSTPGLPPFVPSDLQRAYDYLPLYVRGIKGNGTRIAIIDAFGDPPLSSDLASFDTLTGLPSAPVNLYFPDGVPKFRNSGWALETALDVEWAHAIAPAATIDNVIAFDASFGHIFDAIAFVANSLPNETVLSMSFGAAESTYPATGPLTIAATHQLFVTIASHGTTAFASSGDSGASSCCNIQYPASDPLVASVGGTTLTLKSDASYSSETAWSGSSAGASIVFSKPTWQQGLGDSMRDIVDVSYDGDPNTGVLVVQGGKTFQVGGTSAGSPQWAALAALASQANSIKYGSIAPRLYKISSYHDITAGSDGFFSATIGWDYPTGLGTPDANAIVNALGLFNFTVSNSGGINVLQGGSGSNMISVILVSGTTQAVTLSVNGLPTAANFSFNTGCTGTPTCTASPTFSSILTINSSISTPTGSFTITVTGTGGGQTHTTAFTLTVIPPQPFFGGGGGRTVT